MVSVPSLLLASITSAFGNCSTIARRRAAGTTTAPGSSIAIRGQCVMSPISMSVAAISRVVVMGSTDRRTQLRIGNVAFAAATLARGRSSWARIWEFTVRCTGSPNDTLG